MNANELTTATDSTILAYYPDAVDLAPLFQQKEISILCGVTKTLARAAKRLTVEASRLTPTQSWLSLNKVTAMAANYKHDRKNLPLLIDQGDGRLALLSGHHRIAAQMLNGATQIEARVLRLVNGALVA